MDAAGDVASLPAELWMTSSDLQQFSATQNPVRTTARLQHTGITGLRIFPHHHYPSQRFNLHRIPIMRPKAP